MAVLGDGWTVRLNFRPMTDLSRTMFSQFPFSSSLAHASVKLCTYAATLPLLLYERPVFSASGAGAVLRLNQTSLHICRKTKGKIIRVGVLYTPFPIAELQPMPFRRTLQPFLTLQCPWLLLHNKKKQTHSLKFSPSLRRTPRRETAETSHGARDL